MRMKLPIRSAMRAAGRLTREGDLLGATRIIREALAGGPLPLGGGVAPQGPADSERSPHPDAGGG